MSHNVIIAGITVKVSAKLTKEGVTNPWNSNDEASKRSKHNQFRIFLSSEFARTSFGFTDSAKDYQDGKTEQSDRDLENAVYCFLSDATSGLTDFEDFCRDMGYETDSRSAERIHKSCVKASKQAGRLLNDTYLYEAINQYQETYNC